MLLNLHVFKEAHDTFPAREGRPASESFELVCLDMSQPNQHRMEEMLFVRLSDEQRQKFWGKAAGKDIQFACKKIIHNPKTGKASLRGEIIENTGK